jgi:SAM-dependent methyltransferase
MDMKDAAAMHRLLGDEARLRLLRVLAVARLNVGELTRILGLAQSGVSRHLGLLKEAGLVREERAGGFTFYAIAPEVRLKPDATLGTVRLEPDATGERAETRPGSGARPVVGSGFSRTSTPVGSGFSRTDGHTPLWALLQAQFAAAAHDRIARADDARLQEVLRLRKESFEAHGDERGQLVPGRSWAAWARALGHLLPPLRVADLGCGEGYLTIEAARWAREVIAVDRSRAVLAQARALARRQGVTNIRWKQGEIERVPISDASVEVALLSQALHHAVEPARALAEAARIVIPGGRVLVLDLRHHDQAWVGEGLGDRWLGFEDDALRAMLRQAGLAHVKVTVGARRKGDPFTVIIASGVKQETGARRQETGGRRSR